MRRKYVGLVARGIRCIPVERSQDLAKNGSGLIVQVSEGEGGVWVVKGSDTKFTKEFLAGDFIKLSQPSSIPHSPSSSSLASLNASSACQTVTNVVSDTILHTKGLLAFDGLVFSDEKYKYKCCPHVDQSSTFEAVYDKLASGGAIGIFPEGGSHDQTHLLEMKAGVSVMALGTLAKFPDLPLKIIPVGLNYEQGHRFRSKVLVEFGEPIEITSGMVERYKQGGEAKRAACGTLLNDVVLALRGVTVEAPDYSTLRLLKMMAKLYRASHSFATPEERFVLIRELAAGVTKCTHEPKVKSLLDEISRYDKALRDNGLRDHQVSHHRFMHPPQILLYLLCYRLLLVLAYSLAVLPGLLLCFPVLTTAKVYAGKKAREAVRNSTVKIAGRDVIATWKVLITLVLIPSLHFLYTFLAYFYGGDRMAVSYFFFAPFVCAGAIKCTENGIRVWKSLGALIVGLKGGKYGDDLLKQRNHLKLEIRKVVDEFGWLARLQSEGWTGLTPSDSFSDLEPPQ